MRKNHAYGDTFSAEENDIIDAILPHRSKNPRHALHGMTRIFYHGLMTQTYQRRILERISEVTDDLDELRRVRREIVKGGTASASLSAGGGSKSYTRLDLGVITNLIRECEVELNKLRARLNGSDGAIRRIMFTR